MSYHQNVNYSSPTHYQSMNRASEEIKVVGEGKVSIQPNISIIRLGVLTENKSLNAAQRENAEVTTNVINALLKLGIDQKDIKTADFSINIQYDYVDGKQIFRGYRVRHELEVTNNDVAKTGHIVDTAVQNGANFVTSIQFVSKNTGEYYLQALALAIRNAQTKAITIANTLGIQINTVPTKVVEFYKTSVPSPRPFGETLVLSSQATPIEPGQLDVVAIIEATFSNGLKL